MTLAKSYPLILLEAKKIKDFYSEFAAVKKKEGGKKKKSYGHAHMSSVMNCVKDVRAFAGEVKNNSFTQDCAPAISLPVL